MSRTYRKRFISYTMEYAIPRREDAIKPHFCRLYTWFEDGYNAEDVRAIEIGNRDIIDRNMSQQEKRFRVDFRHATSSWLSMHPPKWFRNCTNRKRRMYDKEEIHRALTTDYEEQCSKWRCKDDNNWGYF